MAAGPREQINRLIRDVEKAARQLRRDFEKRAKSAPKNLQQVGNRLRKLAEMLRKSGIDVATQVEKYLRDLRTSLTGAAKPARAAARKAAPRKRKAAPRKKTAKKPATRRRKRAA
jgi:DNA repair ATPase RecN